MGINSMEYYNVGVMSILTSFLAKVHRITTENCMAGGLWKNCFPTTRYILFWNSPHIKLVNLCLFPSKYLTYFGKHECEIPQTMINFNPIIEKLWLYV